MPESANQARRPAEGNPILVVGIGHVGVAVVHRLHALGVPVRALLTPVEQARQGAELQRLGVETVNASTAWEQDLARQEFSELGAVVLAADNDSGNVDACLLVRRHSADVPMLVRVSDPTLVRFLRVSVPHVEPYSMGSVTAPVAAELALQLLSRGGKGPQVKRPTPRSVRVRTALWTMLVVSVLTTAAGTAALASHLKLPGLEALAAAAGWVLTGAAPDGLKLSSTAHWLAVGLAIADRVALVAGALLVFDWLLQRRLAGVVQPAPVNLHDHVVVLGAGNVGARVAEILHQRRVPVVLVERDGGLRNVQRLRSAGIPVVVGDATVDETLDLAGAWQAAVVLALTSLDAVNLHVGLLLADRKSTIPTVVRLLSPELSDHASRTADVSPLSPVAETANYVCRTVERLRKERGKRKDQIPGSPTPDPARPTGRYAGPEFEAPARNTDQHQKLARAAALAVERAALTDDGAGARADDGDNPPTGGSGAPST